MKQIIHYIPSRGRLLLLALMLGIAAAPALSAQSPPEIRPLTIGDTVPDIVFQHMLNYKDSTARLSDFRGKLVILDFWSASCSSCIELFPHLQSLQKQFSSYVQFILVNGKSAQWHDDEPKIKRLLSHLSERTQQPLLLPVVYNCLPLDTLFPWNTIPHEVWIGKEGRVIAITGAEAVNESNIRQILSGEEPSMPLKMDITFNIGRNSLLELFRKNVSFSGNPVAHFILLKGLVNGLGSQTGVRKDTQNEHLCTGFYITNTPLLQIYQTVYRSELNYPPNRIMIDAKDPERFGLRKSNGSKAYSNVYSYDETLPPTNFSTLITNAKDNLSNTFHTKVTNGKRAINCFIVRSTDKVKESFSKGGKPEYFMSPLNEKKYIRNIPLSQVIAQLNIDLFRIPLIDETGLTQNVDMDYPYKEITQENMMSVLEKAGFKITKETRTLSVGIISDSN